MKLQVNNGVINQIYHGTLPFSEADPFQETSRQERHVGSIWPEWNTPLSSITGNTDEGGIIRSPMKIFFF